METKKCFSFTLWLDGFDDLTDEIENAVYEAGCDDALLGIYVGKPYLAFDREADSFEDALKSAIKAVETVRSRGFSIHIVGVNNDNY